MSDPDPAPAVSPRRAGASPQQVRRFALALPEVVELPHFDMTSFRVRGKIFATMPPDGAHLHAFIDEPGVHAYVAEDPVAFEPLLWGSRVRGVRVRLSAATPDRVRELLEESWRRKAPARLVAVLDQQELNQRALEE